MSAILLLALAYCGAAAERPNLTAEFPDVTLPQLDDLHVTVEAIPTEIRVGDVVFVRTTVTNQGDQPIVLPAMRLSSWSLYLNDEKRKTRFTLGPYGEPTMGGLFAPMEILPGEHVGYVSGSWLSINVPELQLVDAPFWNPETLSEDGYRLSYNMTIGRAVIGKSGPTLTVHPRPKAEMARLVEMCRYRPQTRRDLLPDWDSNAPSLAWFGFMFPPAQASTPENLATLDELLSPGTLRDFVRLTRRARELYDTVIKGPFGEDSSSQPAEGIGAARRKLAALLDWLETFPDVQRQCMTASLLDWATNSWKGMGNFAFEIAVEAALRPSLFDGDLAERRTWLKSRMQTPIAAPYLEDFEKRFKTMESAPPPVPLRDNPPPEAPQDAEILGDPFAAAVGL